MDAVSWTVSAGSTAVVAEGLPTENVRAPDAGWLSAETTRHATM
ncbi:hypothetical protein [Streptomyces nodosus]